MREDNARVAAAVCFGGTSARVQANAQLSQRIQTEADGAVGVAGLEVEDKALAPFLAVGRCGVATAVVLVDVEVAGIQSGFAVGNEIAGLNSLGQA